MMRGQDVFLSYAAGDAAAAATVRHALNEGGLSVFDIRTLVGGATYWEQVRDSLMESEAMVLVLDRATVVPNLAVEIGAALAWSKPIYIVGGAVRPDDLPGYLASFRFFQLDTLEVLVDAIQRSKVELSETELQWLRDWYSGNALPLDQVIRDPASLDKLAAQFERQSGRRISSERLLQALLRLRKRGELPTIGRGKKA